MATADDHICPDDSALLDALESQAASSDGDTVVYLRRHLEAQKRILDDAA